MHLLVVEDDPRLSRVLQRLLSQDRYIVETAASAAEALEVATSNLQLDAIILDIGLPDGSGLNVARTLRKKGSLIPILIQTLSRNRTGHQLRDRFGVVQTMLLRKL